MTLDPCRAVQKLEFAAKFSRGKRRGILYNYVKNYNAKESCRGHSAENGYAETDLLYLGKYEVKEITAPYGYVLNNEPQLVELAYAGQEVTVRDTVNTTFVNNYQGVEISLEKVMENDELFGISAENCYTNVRFGLFAAEEITAADGCVTAQDKSFFHFPSEFFIRLDRIKMCRFM